MKGYANTGEGFEIDPSVGAEDRAVNAIGNFIEFWGFKRNHGRLWALLYLQARPLAASEIQRKLQLSKGGVSMITRELERWGVIHRVRTARGGPWRFVAETDLMAMIGRVLREREATVVSGVRADLDEAKARARASGLEQDLCSRIDRLAALAKLAESAIGLFVRTAQVDASQAVDILRLPGLLMGRKRGQR